jgi:Protein of unknown function (DUF2934)
MKINVKPTLAEADQFSPSGNAIALLAYRLWTERDKRIGSAEEEWLEAIHQIRHSRTPGAVL